jgi:hypothetical protein
MCHELGSRITANITAGLVGNPLPASITNHCRDYSDLGVFSASAVFVVNFCSQSRTAHYTTLGLTAPGNMW